MRREKRVPATRGLMAVACILLTVFVSLFIVVCLLGGQIAAVTETATLDDGTVYSDLHSTSNGVGSAAETMVSYTTDVPAALTENRPAYVLATQHWMCRAVILGHLPESYPTQPVLTWSVAMENAVLQFAGSVGTPPENPAEVIYYLLSLTLGLLICSAVQAIFVRMLTTADPDETYFAQSMDALNFMMRDTRMPHEIRTRVRDYFRKSKRMLKRMSYDMLIDRCLSHELRGDARYQISNSLFRQVWWLDACERSFLEDLSIYIQREAFEAQVKETFEHHERLEFHLAPPILARTDPRTGRPAKRRFGPWVLPLFRLLARMKGLRGTAFDLFGRTAERRMERQLRDDYEALVDEVAAGLTKANLAAARDLLAFSETVRGFGPVREASVRAARAPALHVRAVHEAAEDEAAHVFRWMGAPLQRLALFMAPPPGVHPRNAGHKAHQSVLVVEGRDLVGRP